MTASALLAELSSPALAEWLRAQDVSVALVPIGSTEPHGPHLPLATDSLISEAAARRAVDALAACGVGALVAPTLAYGVTDFAEGFSGAISIPAPVLCAFVRAICDGLLVQGFSHVCLVNNHLEPAHDAAIRAAIEGLAARASVACPLTRRWARTLTPEFKSGACHAGQYETSLVLAAAPALVDMPRAASLPAITISLSEGIKAGKTGFREMGLAAAYTGAPSAATAEEGRDTLALLVSMIVTEITDRLPLGEAPRP